MRLAARGRRDLDAGEESADDPVLAAQLRRQARLVHLESLLLGSALTGLALLMPSD